MFSITPYAPIIEFLPAPGSLNAGWILPAAGLALLILFVAALGWPVSALVRRRYKYEFGVTGRPLLLHRVTRATAWLYLVVVVGWAIILTVIQKDLTFLNGGADIWMRLMQLVLILAIIGSIVAAWNAWVVARSPGRHRTATIWAIVIAIAALFLAWVCLDAGLLTTSLNY
jgi:hypothetical protein